MPDGLFDTPETELLVRLQRADPQAWKEIVARYGPLLRREVSKLIQDQAEAEDVTQEVFLRMYKAINGFKGDTNLLGWAWQVARNAALNDIRNRGNRERLLEEKLPAGEPTQIDPEQAADARETVKRVQTAVAELSEKDRELLAKAADLNTEEPARGAQSPSERSRLSRIRQWLRERILGGEKGR